MRGTDRLFWQFVVALFGVMALFGAAMAAVLIFGDEALGLRMINVFAVMFSSVVSLGTGYLLGHHTSNGNGKGEQ